MCLLRGGNATAGAGTRRQRVPGGLVLECRNAIWERQGAFGTRWGGVPDGGGRTTGNGQRATGKRCPFKRCLCPLPPAPSSPDPAGARSRASVLGACRTPHTILQIRGVLDDLGEADDGDLVVHADRL